MWTRALGTLDPLTFSPKVDGSGSVPGRKQVDSRGLVREKEPAPGAQPPSASQPDSSVGSAVAGQQGSSPATGQQADARFLLEERLAELSQRMEQQQAGSFNLRFRTDEDTGLEFFQIVDKKSGEVIRQYPPEEYLALVENLREVTGLIVSDEV